MNSAPLSPVVNHLLPRTTNSGAISPVKDNPENLAPNVPLANARLLFEILGIVPWAKAAVPWATPPPLDGLPL